MIFKIGTNGVGGFKLYFKHETCKRLTISDGMKAWFYHNEHGYFFKPQYPNTQQEEPKNSIEANIIAVIKINPFTDFVINNTNLGRNMREFFAQNNKLDLDNQSVCSFQLIETNKADVFRIKFIDQVTRKTKVTEEYKKSLRTSETPTPFIQQPEPQPEVRTKRKYTRRKEKAFFEGILKDNEKIVEEPKMVETTTTNEVKIFSEVSTVSVRELTYQERSSAQKKLRNLTNWCKKEMKEKTERLIEEKVTDVLSQDELHWTMQDVIDILYKTKERIEEIKESLL